MEYETKSSTPEIKSAFDDFLSAFEQFKQANDTRLAELERRGADVVTEEKVDRIDKALGDQKRALDTLLLDAARPQLGGERKANDLDTRERKSAFDRYVRKGDASALDTLELKTTAFSAGSNADGGYTVPLEIEQTIDRVLAKASPIRASSDLSTAVSSPAGIIWSASTDSLGCAPYFSRSRTSLNTCSSWPW